MNDTTSSVGIVKGYQEQVNRLRNAQKEKVELEKLAQRRLRGEEYDRLKLAKMRPPSFN